MNHVQESVKIGALGAATLACLTQAARSFKRVSGATHTAGKFPQRMMQIAKTNTANIGKGVAWLAGAFLSGLSAAQSAGLVNLDSDYPPAPVPDAQDLTTGVNFLIDQADSYVSAATQPLRDADQFVTGGMLTTGFQTAQELYADVITTIETSTGLDFSWMKNHPKSMGVAAYLTAATGRHVYARKTRPQAQHGLLAFITCGLMGGGVTSPGVPLGTAVVAFTAAQLSTLAFDDTILGYFPDNAFGDGAVTVEQLRDFAGTIRLRHDGTQITYFVDEKIGERESQTVLKHYLRDTLNVDAANVDAAAQAFTDQIQPVAPPQLALDNDACDALQATDEQLAWFPAGTFGEDAATLEGFRAFAKTLTLSNDDADTWMVRTEGEVAGYIPLRDFLESKGVDSTHLDDAVRLFKDNAAMVPQAPQQQVVTPPPERATTGDGTPPAPGSDGTPATQEQVGGSGSTSTPPPRDAANDAQQDISREPSPAPSPHPEAVTTATSTSAAAVVQHDVSWVPDANGATLEDKQAFFGTLQGALTIPEGSDGVVTVGFNNAGSQPLYEHLTVALRVSEEQAKVAYLQLTGREYVETQSSDDDGSTTTQADATPAASPTGTPHSELETTGDGTTPASNVNLGVPAPGPVSAAVDQEAQDAVFKASLSQRGQTYFDIFNGRVTHDSTTGTYTVSNAFKGSKELATVLRDRRVPETEVQSIYKYFTGVEAPAATSVAQLNDADVQPRSPSPTPTPSPHPEAVTTGDGTTPAPGPDETPAPQQQVVESGTTTATPPNDAANDAQDGTLVASPAPSSHPETVTTATTTTSASSVPTHRRSRSDGTGEGLHVVDSLEQPVPRVRSLSAPRSGHASQDVALSSNSRSNSPETAPQPVYGSPGNPVTIDRDMSGKEFNQAVHDRRAEVFLEGDRQRDTASDQNSVVLIALDHVIFESSTALPQGFTDYLAKLITFPDSDEVAMVPAENGGQISLEQLIRERRNIEIENGSFQFALTPKEEEWKEELLELVFQTGDETTSGSPSRSRSGSTTSSDSEKGSAASTREEVDAFHGEVKFDLGSMFKDTSAPASADASNDQPVDGTHAVASPTPLAQTVVDTGAPVPEVTRQNILATRKNRGGGTQFLVAEPDQNPVWVDYTGGDVNSLVARAEFLNTVIGNLNQAVPSLFSPVQQAYILDQRKANSAPQTPAPAAVNDGQPVDGTHAVASPTPAPSAVVRAEVQVQLTQDNVIAYDATGGVARFAVAGPDGQIQWVEDSEDSSTLRSRTQIMANFISGTAKNDPVPAGLSEAQKAYIESERAKLLSEKQTVVAEPSEQPTPAPSTEQNSNAVASSTSAAATPAEQEIPQPPLPITVENILDSKTTGGSMQVLISVPNRATMWVDLEAPAFAPAVSARIALVQKLCMNGEEIPADLSAAQKAYVEEMRKAALD